jgi:hypothetical protein
MRKLIAVSMLLACFGAGRASAAFTIQGTIQIPGPTGRVSAGVTETTNPCGRQTGGSSTNGLDGFWFELPGAGEVTATMTSTALDANVYFYDADCHLIGGTADPVATSMATDATADEQGVVPAAARYAIVDLIAGSNVFFTFATD